MKLTSRQFKIKAMMNGQTGLCAQNPAVSVQKKEHELVWRDLVRTRCMKVLNAKLMDVSYSHGLSIQMIFINIIINRLQSVDELVFVLQIVWKRQNDNIKNLYRRILFPSTSYRLKLSNRWM